MRDYIDAAAFKEMILCAEAALTKNVELINELNVFPVPDGDTGTNMALTMQSAGDELRKKDFNTVEEISACIANATLRGARGNSGVITSLLFRGISKRLKGLDTAGMEEFSGALSDGVDAAYKAVMKPAEGTILTVSRHAARAACDAAKLGADLEGVFICAIKAGNKSLENTKEINPVLKKAGVVDAGGKGFMIMLEAMISSLRGDVEAPAQPIEVSGKETAFDKFDTEEITFAFDTVFVVRKKSVDQDISLYRNYLDTIGDSIVIGESDESFKVHVHTDIPGQVITEAQKYGALELCKIENMKMQHDDLLSGKKARSTDDLEQIEEELEQQKPTEPTETKPFGIVSVCAGHGLEGIFKELGADGIITGGQTMNPSTNDILGEINKTNAETVFVLPNNKNIIMAAEQCQPLTDKKVVVVPTKTVPQGIAAMLNFDISCEEEENTSAMLEAIENVHTAMITYAARNSDFDGQVIHAGEYLALLDGKLIGSYTNIKTLLGELTWAFNELNPEEITLYYGEDVSEADAEEAGRIIEGVFPEADISVIYGGQPVYYYMLSVE